MCPQVGAVLGHVDGHVAHETDALLVRIGTQTLPLAEEQALRALPEEYLVRELSRCRGERLGVAQTQLVPCAERLAAARALDGHEERVVLEPCVLARAELFELVAARIEQTPHGMAKHAETLLVQQAVIDARRVAPPRDRLVLTRLEQPLVAQVIEVDEVRIACERRARLIRRVAVARRADRQQLPDRLPGRNEEIYEGARLGTERAHAPRRGQRGNRHQDAGASHASPPLNAELPATPGFRSLPTGRAPRRRRRHAYATRQGSCSTARTLSRLSS